MTDDTQPTLPASGSPTGVPGGDHRPGMTAFLEPDGTSHVYLADGLGWPATGSGDQ